MALAGAFLLSFGALAAAEDRSFTILAVNDVYRIEGVAAGRLGGLARLRTLRRELERADGDVLVLHGGDVLSPSFVGRLFKGAQMIDVLNHLDGDGPAFDRRLFVTFGNHEFDASGREGAALLAARVGESRFTWLSANVRFDRDDAGKPLVGGPALKKQAIVEIGGIRVGLFGLTTGIQKPDYVATIADPLATARHHSDALRRAGAEVVVALTHLSVNQDKGILQRLGAAGPDLIIGGHEHTQLSAEVRGRWVIKADSDAVTATVARVRLDVDGPPAVTFRNVSLGPDAPARDPAVAERVQDWLIRHGERFCGERKLAPDCLTGIVGRTAVDLNGEEIAMRSREATFGNWIADTARDAFRNQGAQVAFINSGALRLNETVPAGTTITRRHIEEAFPFPSRLRLIDIDGATLKRLFAGAAKGWPGHGRWLQISGAAFRHDPATGRVDRVTLLGPDGPRPVRDDETVRAVTLDYLVRPAGGQDGYRMLGPRHLVAGADTSLTLRGVAIDALRRAGRDGIAPAVEGRICAVGGTGPCRAVAQ
jgi:2',3'-cyclic-nucleotide 2'-phosphodiesterase (5'-nucleotidase family)